jgi:hypothetical protein
MQWFLMDMDAREKKRGGGGGGGFERKVYSQVSKVAHFDLSRVSR